MATRRSSAAPATQVMRAACSAARRARKPAPHFGRGIGMAGAKLKRASASPADFGFLRPARTSLEQFVDRFVRAVLGERDVLEAAAERIVLADRGVVDAEGRVERARDVLGAHVAVAAP